MNCAKIIYRIKNFIVHFSSEHNFRILDILRFLKRNIGKYSYGGGARGPYLPHGLYEQNIEISKRKWQEKLECKFAAK